MVPIIVDLVAVVQVITQLPILVMEIEKQNEVHGRVIKEIMVELDLQLTLSMVLVVEEVLVVLE